MTPSDVKTRVPLMTVGRTGKALTAVMSILLVLLAGATVPWGPTVTPVPSTNSFPPVRARGVLSGEPGNTGGGGGFGGGGKGGGGGGPVRAVHPAMA